MVFTGNGSAISSLIFSLDFDEVLLSFDPNDGDGDGVPDAISFDLPAAFNGSVTYDPTDTDSELDFFIITAFSPPPLASLLDGSIVQISFTAASPAETTDATILFSQNPVASYGDVSGQSTGGISHDGSVKILKTLENFFELFFAPVYTGVNE